MAKIKTQIVFPEELLDQVDRVVKKKERSEFVVEAVRDRLKNLKLRDALDRVAGLWKNRADLKTDAAQRRYLKRLRESGDARARRIRKAGRGG